MARGLARTPNPASRRNQNRLAAFSPVEVSSKKLVCVTSSTISQLTLSASSSASNHQQARFLISLAQPPRHGVINNSNPGTTTALQLHATAITPTRHGLLSRKRADNSVDTRQTTERRRGESPTQYPIFSYPAAGREDSLVLTAVCPRDR